MKTYKELLIEASGDYVQNACNLSGLVIALQGVLRNLRELDKNVNTDLVTQLWMSKLTSLSGYDYLADQEKYNIFTRARELIEGGIN